MFENDVTTLLQLRKFQGVILIYSIGMQCKLFRK
jgi:hypothetical protein